MKHSTSFIFLGFILLIYSCKSTQPSVTKKPHTDINFSKYRVEYQDTVLDMNAPPTPAENYITRSKKSTSESIENVNDKLEKHLKKIAVNNQKIKYTYGYVVQIYSGGDRQDANSHIRDARSITNEDVKLEYKEPNYKVHIGNYLSRAQAYFTYIQMKDVFPSAVIIPGKVEIERYKYDKKLKNTTKENAEEADDQK